MASRDIMTDAKRFLGLPPHNVARNHMKGDSIFGNDCARHWGAERFRAACSKAKRLHNDVMKARKKALK